MKLVAKLSLQVACGSLAEDDAISAGNIGLMQALECRRFTPRRGVRFGTYIRQFVRGRVLEALRAKSRVPS